MRFYLMHFHLFLSLFFIFISSFFCIAEETRPNFVVIVTDDQRLDSFTEAIMPKTYKHLVNKGVNFSRAYITTPACCPSRSSILTGKYVKNHGVRGNRFKLKHPTVFQALDKAGYYTGAIGKYLNSWSGEKRPEFDYWFIHNQGSVVFNNPRFNEQGVWKNFSGYVTEILEEKSLSFLDRAIEQAAPFALLLTPNAPHRPAYPAPKYLDKFPNQKPYRPISFNCSRRKGKPRYIKKTDCLSRKRVKALDVFARKQHQTLLSVDDMVEKIVLKLESKDVVNKTVIFFISDNGIMRGEFGLLAKDVPYDGAVHVPFVVRYPSFGTPGLEKSELVANIDIAPTMYKLSGIGLPSDVDGLSLSELFKATPSWRSNLLLEGYRNFSKKKNNSKRRPFASLMTDNYQLVVNFRESRNPLEFYNILKDPYTVKNLYRKSEERERIKSLMSDLLKLRPDLTKSKWLSRKVKKKYLN